MDKETERVRILAYTSAANPSSAQNRNTLIPSPTHPVLFLPILDLSLLVLCCCWLQSGCKMAAGGKQKQWNNDLNKIGLLVHCKGHLDWNGLSSIAAFPEIGVKR